MKIRIYSDIHVEFAPFEPPACPDDAETTCILAGDIWTKGRTLDAFKAWAPRFRAVLFVLGNHDFWGGSLVRTPQKLQEQLKQAQAAGELANVHLLDCNSVVIDGTAFVGATLWTDYAGKDALAVAMSEKVMTDFKKIRTGPTAAPYAYRLKAGHLVQEHQRARQYIERAVREHREAGRQVVAVTHHVPSFALVHPWHSDDPSIGAYASDFMDALPPESLPDAWVWGHQHESAMSIHRDVVCLANPRGYADNGENPYFDEGGFGVELGELDVLREQLPDVSETLFPGELDDDGVMTMSVG